MHDISLADVAETLSRSKARLIPAKAFELEAHYLTSLPQHLGKHLGTPVRPGQVGIQERHAREVYRLKADRESTASFDCGVSRDRNTWPGVPCR